MLTPISDAEFRRDVDLPHVRDGDRTRVAQLAKLLPKFIDGAIPGVGILHTSGDLVSAAEAHNAHQVLISQALDRLQPSLVVNKKFIPTNPSYAGGEHRDLGMHFDGYDPHWRAQHDNLRALWLLHTSAEGTAKVRLVNSRAGAFQPQQGRAELGDGKLFLDSFGKLRPLTHLSDIFGYSGLDGISDDNLFDDINNGSFDPITTDAEVHHFAQGALSSVLLRISSMVGPATAHDFTTVPGTARRIITSSLDVACSEALPQSG